ncbi:receptor like protein 22-like [Prosopis cineraria]|uniref:receptor like protein 22-like n=1 Tax=Prosopis cineraria TaxID=364024 RepID=UPI0024107955|nr:receptor like protein 22-like [Prosopis cineraria]
MIDLVVFLIYHKPLILSSFNIFQVTGHCLIGHQESALLHLKNSLTFNPANSQKLVHWNQSDDCCRWNGVTCNKKGFVIVLDLSEESISGGVDNASGLFNLQHLQDLNLAYNDFHSSIPLEFHKLKNLRHLNLSNAGFEGQIPIAVSQLTNLVSLDLSSNNFTGRLPYFNMSKNLKYLSVSLNHLTGEILSSHFESLDNLTTIDLVGNSFYRRVPSCLFALPSLRELMLSHNRFEGVLDEFPNASFSSLEILDLSGNNLEGPIPLSIFQFRRLSFLQLSSNKFNGTMHLDAVRKMENLVTLGVNHNNLSVDTTLRDNSDDLLTFPRLSQLMLASCKLKEFPIFMRNQSNLIYLDLSSNQIHGSIPNWIWRFDFMVFLNLSNNFLTDLEGPFQNISTNLFVIDLHSNQLQGSTPIFSKYLLYLDFSSNRFSYIAPSDIDNKLHFAFFLSLSNNSFHGKIPESFCTISNLRVLDLSDNGFNDTIPECLTGTISSTLRVLNLARNKLKGHILDTFSTSCALRFLDLNENFLRGVIPKSLANCQKLQVLNLGINQLIDRFPCFLKNISTLKVMILRSNNFHGPLACSHSTGNWDTLQIVDLASNKFTGTLPRSLLQSWKALMLDGETGSQSGHLFFDINEYINPMGFWSALYSLLTKNLALKLAKIMEAMPPFLIDHFFYDVYFLDFGGRSYEDSVTIVNKGRQMKLVKIHIAFTSLDFSSNHFEGPIPEELMSFKALHALNLSLNAFSSHIPSSIGNLKYLESLDLSANSFSGNIPTELASLSFLEVLNLSVNHLIGPIPTGTQIQSFDADSFEGNEGLCGPPLTHNCNFGVVPTLSPPSSETSMLNSKSSIDWNFLSAELGFIFGLGIVILPLIFWKQWRLKYFKHVDSILWKIIPQLDFAYENHGGRIYKSLRWKPF